MKTVAILQSNYIPWKGNFDMIHMVDEFILYDDMQYTRRDWRNRNRIKTPAGPQWLTIPVDVKGKFTQKIKETQVADHSWCRSHLRALEINYAHAPFFHLYYDELARLYRDCETEDFLSRINYRFLKAVCGFLSIDTKISWSWDYPQEEGKTERLASLVKAAGGDIYLSGPAAKDYIREEVFTRAGIGLTWMDYTGYPEYPQLYGNFVHEVSILDLLFHTGKEAPAFMKSWH